MTSRSFGAPTGGATSTDITNAITAHDAAADPHGDRAAATGALSAHTTATTSVHGITDTAVLETSSGAAAKVSAHTGASDPHGDRAYTLTQTGLLLAKASNLSDLASAATARTNLGLGTAATSSFGSAIPPVAAGVGSAGVAATPARSDHAHPVNALRPADHGLIAWNFPPYAATSTALAPASGTVYLMKVPIPVGQTITNVIVGINVAGSGLTSNQNFLALYSSAKALLSATADQTTSWGSVTGPVTVALSTPQVVAAGYVHVAFLSNGTTPPTLNRGAGNINNVGLSSSTAAFATGGTSQTSMPGTVTTTAYTAASVWAAVS